MAAMNYGWTMFELRDGVTHTQAYMWFDEREFYHQQYSTHVKEHEVHLNGMEHAQVIALLAKDDCPVTMAP